MLDVDTVLLLHLLFNSMHKLLESLQAEDENDDNDVEGDNGQSPHDESNGSAEVCNIVECVESDVLLGKAVAHELGQVGPSHEKSQTPDEEPSAEQSGEDEDNDSHEAQNQKRPKTGSLIRGLGDVLRQAGLDQFVPKEGEPEGAALGRVRRMAPFMQGFSALVRCQEKVLSRASIVGRAPSKMAHNILEFQLAEARAEYHCSAQRQSRFALWADFSGRILKCLQDLSEEEPEKDHDGVREIKHLHPNSCLNASGDERVCQIVVIRPFMTGGELGPCRIALVVGAWRGGKTSKKGKEVPWCGAGLPINAATRVHCKMLVPANIRDDQKRELLIANSKSHVFSLPAHNGGLVVEVPPDCFSFEYQDTQLKVWLCRKSIRCMKQINESNIPFQAKPKDADSVPVFFTEEDFARGGSGTNKNIAKFMNGMRRDQEVHFGQFVTKDSAQTVKLRPACSIMIWVKKLFGGILRCEMARVCKNQVESVCSMLKDLHYLSVVG